MLIILLSDHVAASPGTLYALEELKCVSEAALCTLGCLVDTKCAGFLLPDPRKAVDGIHDVHPEVYSYKRDAFVALVGVAAAREV